MTSGKTRLPVQRISGERFERLEDVVVKERPVTIFFNDDELASLMCSPKDLDYLAVGFSFAEGLVRNKKDIRKVIVDDKDDVVWVYSSRPQKLPPNFAGRRFITSGCGRGLTLVDTSGTGLKLRTRSKLKLQASRVPHLMKEFLHKSRLFKTTGGAHSAALCSSSDILVFNEDIGRHSAIDKVFGECILKGIKMSGRILVTSGRISSEILVKVARSGVPIVISKSAPTDLAVKLADEIGITLVGFARGSRMNVYSAGWRILTRARTKGKAKG